jgi:hypothetical protein
MAVVNIIMMRLGRIPVCCRLQYICYKKEDNISSVSTYVKTAVVGLNNNKLELTEHKDFFLKQLEEMNLTLKKMIGKLGPDKFVLIGITSLSSSSEKKKGSLTNERC